MNHSPSVIESPVESQALACMEVWGGNQATFSAFEKSGIDIWLYSRPCRKDTNGGDVYFLSSCASGRITRMLLADVSGHGEAVSDVASGLRQLMRQYINTIRPNKLFAEMNSDFTSASACDRFATSVVCSYFLPTSTLSVCNAGHPMPLLCRAGSRNWHPIELPEGEQQAEDMPLGIIPVSQYNQLNIPLQAGDLVLCYTDGVIESKDSQGKMLGIDGLQEILDALQTDPPESLLPRLVEEIGRKCGGDTHEDDVTILLYRITKRAIPIRDNLAAPLRWLRSLLSRS